MTVQERVESFLASRNVQDRARILLQDLNGSNEEILNPAYADAEEWIRIAQEVYQGNCPTMLHRRIRSRVDSGTLRYVATGKAGAA